MRTSSALLLAALLALGGVPTLGAAPARAFDGEPAADGARAAPFGSVGEALRAGVRDLKGGDKRAAVRALQFAATQGNLAAGWKLGRMYQDGDGVARDDAAAYRTYAALAAAGADVAPDSPDAAAVSKALVAVGSYLLDGVPGAVKADPARAQALFHHAASTYADADAQYALGRMLADGAAGPRDPRQGARWLRLAADKGHRPAQAVLGGLLFNGDGVPRQPARGLMWLHLASEGDGAAPEPWIAEMAERAAAVADERDRRAARALLEAARR